MDPRNEIHLCRFGSTGKTYRNLILPGNNCRCQRGCWPDTIDWSCLDLMETRHVTCTPTDSTTFNIFDRSRGITLKTEVSKLNIFSTQHSCGILSHFAHCILYAMKKLYWFHPLAPLFYYRSSLFSNLTTSSLESFAEALFNTKITHFFYICQLSGILAMTFRCEQLKLALHFLKSQCFVLNVPLQRMIQPEPQPQPPQWF